MPIAVQDMKNGLKSDQAAAALMFRLVNEFSQTKFLQRLYEQNWEAFASIARVYVTVVSEVSNRPTYYAYALALHDNEAHEELQGMVLRAPQG